VAGWGPRPPRPHPPERRGRYAPRPPPGGRGGGGGSAAAQGSIVCGRGPAPPQNKFFCLKKSMEWLTRKGRESQPAGRRRRRLRLRRRRRPRAAKRHETEPSSKSPCRRVPVRRATGKDKEKEKEQERGTDRYSQARNKQF